MTKTDLLEELRVVIDDVAGPPYGWADKRLLRWMADGEDRFCELTGFFNDASTYTITTTETDGIGDIKYLLPSDRIIEVREVLDGYHRLHQFTELDRPAYYNPLTTPNKRPQAWQMDKDTGFITLLEPPLAGIVLTLRVHRRAAARFDTSGVTAPSIPQQCHLALVEYAAAQAFGDHDRERQDPVKAKDHMANFWRYIKQGQDLFSSINGGSPRITPARQYVV